MNRLVFVNRFYAPDHSATSQLLTQLCQSLVESGQEVCVVCSRLSYSDQKTRHQERETIEGVSVRRLWSTGFGRRRLLLRMIDYLTFYMSLMWHVLFGISKRDLVVFKTDPPMMSAFLWPIVRIRRIRYINWLQDVFPDVARALSVRGMARPLFKLLSALRNAALKRAETNVVIGHRMHRLLSDAGIPQDRLDLITNWTPSDDINPVPRADNPLVSEWSLDDRFVIGYSGNLGRAHPVASIRAAIEHFQDDEHVRFLMIGSGFRYLLLKSWCAEQGFDHVLFRPYQPLEQLSESLSASHVHLVSLYPQLEGLIVPSKAYGLYAAGRPMIMIGDRSGELGMELANNCCGLSVAHDDPDSLITAIKRFRDDEQFRLDCEQNARALYENHYTLPQIREQWLRLIGRLNRAPGL